MPTTAMAAKVSGEDKEEAAPRRGRGRPKKEAATAEQSDEF